MSITGGCQCGAVRFRADGLGEASICHCRMCQKATGGLFGPYVALDGLVWTRGERRRFQSSNKVWRGFCEACGTPLTWEHAGGLMSVTIGALDDPARVRVSEQLGSAAKVPWVDDLPRLPVHEPTEPQAAAHLASIVSRQHPDHDT
ncbi:MAG: GFA family protein [Phenylobacterium sp.]|uniref:GFA family protein n=1 Tax=Phenylobacterium sp. TaxID=1871053 RepID=UPI001A5F3C2A|nr:GFA family protein [Phenylobacterium sp.]MBL8554418.1 GFA family protein [Phenylobacterium sp.]